VRNFLAALVLALAAPAVACAEPQPAGAPIEAQGPAGVLRGTLLTPEDAGAGGVVLSIPGSRPTDRDGNNTMGIRAASYRLLAEALAEQGVSSVRIDKRGMFESAAEGIDPNNIVIADYAADVAAWTATIRQRTGARCVWLAGHSEGALVALAAAQSDANVCGLVLIAGPGRRLADVLREQLVSNPANAPLLADAERIISALEAGQRVPASEIPAPLQPLFREQVQGFVISLFSYDPAELVRSYSGPVLVMQGTTDLQVTMADAEALAGARAGVELARLESVNHVLKTAPAERDANLATYSSAHLPLAPGVAERIAAFIEANAAPNP
jgi:pimeloyl-ACP methyl ester carboxylesterase